MLIVAMLVALFIITLHYKICLKLPAGILGMSTVLSII